MDFLLIFFRGIDIVLSILTWTIFVWVILSWILFFTRNSRFRWRNRGLYAASIVDDPDRVESRKTRPCRSSLM